MKIACFIGEVPGMTRTGVNPDGTNYWEYAPGTYHALSTGGGFSTPEAEVDIPEGFVPFFADMPATGDQAIDWYGPWPLRVWCYQL